MSTLCVSELGFENLEAGKGEIQKLDHLIPKDAGRGSGVLGVSLPGSAEAPLSDWVTRSEWVQQSLSWSSKCPDISRA